jgi:hypothetical protein
MMTWRTPAGYACVWLPCTHHRQCSTVLSAERSSCAGTHRDGPWVCCAGGIDDVWLGSHEHCQRPA